MVKQCVFFGSVLLSVALIVGCGDAKTDKTTAGKTDPGKTVSGGKTEHDPEDKPLTDQEKQTLKAGIKDYKDAVAKIKSYRDTIRKETTEGRPARAHRSLDELDLVLEWLPEFAEKSGVPEAKLADVTKSAQRLRDAFNKVHAQIGAGEKPDYPAVADTIESEIKTLENAAA
jgi:hypothetical protein